MVRSFEVTQDDSKVNGIVTRLRQARVIGSDEARGRRRGAISWNGYSKMTK